MNDIHHMREKVRGLYPWSPNWKSKVDRMSDQQVRNIYYIKFEESKNEVPSGRRRS